MGKIYSLSGKFAERAKQFITKKLYSWKLSIRSDHPRRRIEIQFGVVGGLWVLSFKFCRNRQSGYRDARSQNLPNVISLLIGSYSTLYYRTVSNARLKSCDKKWTYIHVSRYHALTNVWNLNCQWHAIYNTLQYAILAYVVNLQGNTVTAGVYLVFKGNSLAYHRGHKFTTWDHDQDNDG